MVDDMGTADDRRLSEPNRASPHSGELRRSAVPISAPHSCFAGDLVAELVSLGRVQIPPGTDERVWKRIMREITGEGVRP